MLIKKIWWFNESVVYCLSANANYWGFHGTDSFFYRWIAWSISFFYLIAWFDQIQLLHYGVCMESWSGEVIPDRSIPYRHFWCGAVTWEKCTVQYDHTLHTFGLHNFNCTWLNAGWLKSHRLNVELAWGKSGTKRSFELLSLLLKWGPLHAKCLGCSCEISRELGQPYEISWEHLISAHHFQKPQNGIMGAVPSVFVSTYLHI